MMTPKEQSDYEEALRRIAKAEQQRATTLDLSNLLNVPDAILKQVATLSSLLELDLSWCRQIADLSPLSPLTSLQSLNLHRCAQIADLRPLSALTSLRSLDLSYCTQIADLRWMSSLASLQSLDLSYCPLTSISTRRTVCRSGSESTGIQAATAKSFSATSFPWYFRTLGSAIGDIAPKLRSTGPKNFTRWSSTSNISAWKI